MKDVPPVGGLCYCPCLPGMEVPHYPFLRATLARAASLFAACLVVSCATSGDSPQASFPDRGLPTVADSSMERVVVQAYRAIGDRHLYEPNFRNLSSEAYRSFASGDPSLALETSDGAFTVRRTFGDAWAQLDANLKDHTYEITCS